MDDWRKHRSWLKALNQVIPDDADTPCKLARFELDSFFGNGNAGITLAPEMGEGYRIIDENGRYTVIGGETGALYGAYALINARTLERKPECLESKPYYALRMIDCWDNMDGSVERGYSGRSLWFEGGRFCYEPDRIRFLGRLLANVGINTLVINNVNVHYPAQELIGNKLDGVAELARLLRPFGVRLMLSIDFSMPLSDGVPTADPLDERVIDWWKQRAKLVWDKVPDLAGFLVKADSEHRPGPNVYQRTHAEGANMLARAIAPHGGTLVWRAFVYNCTQSWKDTVTDRPKAAYELYKPLDGKFDDNVILQVKHGPFDFQVREPISPLLLGVSSTRMALEVQLAQEYTGHQIDLYAMAPMFKEIFEQMEANRVCAVAAVSNLGRDANMSGHPFAMFNLFAFGRLAWNPYLEPDSLVEEWIKLTYDLCDSQCNELKKILLESRGIYEKYTATLGLNWMVQPHVHYGPNPWGYEFDFWGTYNRADRNAVGIDRTSNGTAYTLQYPQELREQYENTNTCPNNLLLFFHRLPYDYVMRDGRTLIQRIYDDHFEGANDTMRMLDALRRLDLPDEDKDEVIKRAEMQVKNAAEWRDVINTFFHRLSGVDDAHGRRIYD